MVIRTNLDYLSEVLQTYNRAFRHAVFRENRIPTVEEAENFNNELSLLHWSGVRQVLAAEFNRNRDNLPGELFERYCKSVIGVIKVTKENLIPFRDRYNLAFYTDKAIDSLHHLKLLTPLNAYLWSVDDLEERVKFYFPKLVSNDDGLSAAEIAIMHHYLVKAGVEKYIIPAEVGKKYSHLRNAKNIETAYGKIDKGIFEPSRKQLENVLSSLGEYPKVQKAVINDIANLS